MPEQPSVLIDLRSIVPQMGLDPEALLARALVEERLRLACVRCDCAELGNVQRPVGELLDVPESGIG
jgi:hypothetical protein